LIPALRRGAAQAIEAAATIAEVGEDEYFASFAERMTVMGPVSRRAGRER